jgi:two-component system chemotaxis response regulator CheY
VSSKILIVEDSTDARDMLALLFDMEGYSVATAEDGREGLRRASAESPDLIVTDINMPHIDGTEMIRRLRAEPGSSRVPIIVMTAYGDDIAERAVRSGADRALTKPVDYDLLLETIKDLIN